MSYENVLFRSFRGIVFISITPFILLTASLWFSSDETAFILAHVSQVYFSILLFFLAGIIWGMRASLIKEQTELLLIAFVPILIATIGGISSFYINPAWGVGFLLLTIYGIRHVKVINDQINKLEQPYVVLIDKISIILCICLMVILTYWLNPYTNPLEVYY